MRDKVLETIQKFNMLSDTCKVVVGISGGADSSALLHFLKGICDGRGIKIVAAHVNHNLRGEEAYKDQEFVREFCKNLGVELHIKNANIKELSNRLGQSTEECGRNVRYSYFYHLADTENSKIAVAHTLSDNLETMIFNFVRGSGLKGICGISPTRDKIIRPFIHVSRDEIEKYCQENGINFVTDSSNFEDVYTRNKIRIKIIPELKKINPALEQSCLRLSGNISLDDDFLDSYAENEVKNIETEVGFDASKIRDLHPAIKNRVIFKILKSINSKYTAKKHVDLVSKLIDGDINAVCIDNKVVFLENRKNLKIKPLCEQDNPQKTAKNWQLSVKKVNILTQIQRILILNEVSFAQYLELLENDKKVGYNSLSIDTDLESDDELVFRTRRPGDKFAPLGRSVTKTLKKLFNEIKISIKSRDELLLIAKGNEVLWIEGIGACQRCRVRENSKSIYVIQER